MSQRTWIKKVVTSERTNASVILCGRISRCLSPPSHRAMRPRRTYSAAMKPHGDSVTKRYCTMYMPLLSGWRCKPNREAMPRAYATENIQYGEREARVNDELYSAITIASMNRPPTLQVSQVCGSAMASTRAMKLLFSIRGHSAAKD